MPQFVPQQQLYPVYPAPQTTTEIKVKETPRKTVVKVTTTDHDALDELNRQRAQRGLRPYARCPGLTQAAMACAKFRAKHRCHGHVQGGMSDFAFIPQGYHASCTGAEAPGQNYPPGFWTCAMYEPGGYAGAARAFDANGEQYMSLFLKE